MNYAFQNEQKKHSIVGYRVYIDSAKKFLASGRFDVIGLKPDKINSKILSSIQATLEEDFYFSNAIKTLIYSGRKISNATLTRSIDLLRKIYIENFISEYDILFKDKRNLEILLQKV